LEQLIERARAEGTPLIDGERVTFVWYGDQAPYLIADFLDWEADPQPLEKAGEQVWIYSATIPRQAYIEYAYLDISSGTRSPDPLNSRRVPNGIGNTNHYFYMPGCEPSRLTRKGRGIPQGQIDRYEVVTKDLAVGESRPVYLYRPATGQIDSILVVLDGQDYLGRGKIAQIPITTAQVAFAHDHRARPHGQGADRGIAAAKPPAFLRHCVFPQLHRKPVCRTRRLATQARESSVPPGG
jgi:enterochelin esterase family protein